MQDVDDKKRSKLGYQRISIACAHCRRRKIRCLLAEDDPQGRCQNCIRLKKECIFSAVEQQAVAESSAQRLSQQNRSEPGPSSASSMPTSGEDFAGSTYPFGIPQAPSTTSVPPGYHGVPIPPPSPSQGHTQVVRSVPKWQLTDFSPGTLDPTYPLQSSGDARQYLQSDGIYVREPLNTTTGGVPTPYWQSGQQTSTLGYPYTLQAQHPSAHLQQRASFPAGPDVTGQQYPPFAMPTRSMSAGGVEGYQVSVQGQPAQFGPVIEQQPAQWVAASRGIQNVESFGQGGPAYPIANVRQQYPHLSHQQSPFAFQQRPQRLPTPQGNPPTVYSDPSALEQIWEEESPELSANQSTRYHGHPRSSRG